MRKVEKQYTYNPSFKSRLKSLNVLNPISYYGNRYLKKSARLSQTTVQKIIPSLEGKINFVEIANSRNTKISAWDINPSQSDTYVFFLHGMAQNITDYQRLYETVIGKNAGVFALEFRGYGSNPRAFLSEDRLRKDINKAYEYLTKEKKIKPQNIILVGHSMGGALATDFATKHKDLKSLILICPIYNLHNLGHRFLENTKLGAGIPKSVIKITSWLKPLEWLNALRFSTANKIGKLKTPTYLLQSKNDAVTTIENARLLARRARNAGVLEKFYVFPNGGHKVDNKKIESISKILDNIFSQQ